MEKEKKLSNKEIMERNFKLKQRKKIINILILLTIVFILIAGLIYKTEYDKLHNMNPHKYSQSQLSCLKNQYTMYGADWCPHCHKQKKDMGTILANKVYVNCEKNKLKCDDVGVTGYPLNIVMNKDTQKITRFEGEIPMEKIVNASGCFK